jgi:hypothetical protein
VILLSLDPGDNVIWGSNRDNVIWGSGRDNVIWGSALAWMAREAGAQAPGLGAAQAVRGR